MAIVNITVENDADFYQAFQYQTVSGAPINITGATLWMMLRRHAQDDTALMRLGSDTGEIVLTDPVNGLFTIYIAQIELARLGLGEYDHSLIMGVGTYKHGIWTGTFTNNPGASR